MYGCFMYVLRCPSLDCGAGKKSQANQILSLLSAAFKLLYSPLKSQDEPTQYTLKQRKATTRIRQLDERDYYSILGLKKGCSLAEIRKAYRDLAMCTHPDQNKFEDAEVAFKSKSSDY
ncbi:hypothetical protein BJX70DRAFT_384811 [Aspergillus crustosus]